METSDQKYWRLYQFDFMGLRNTTDVLTTTAGEKDVSRGSRKGRQLWQLSHKKTGRTVAFRGVMTGNDKKLYWETSTTLPSAEVKGRFRLQTSSWSWQESCLLFSRVQNKTQPLCPELCTG